jgi:hypothetical protein
MGAVGQVTMSGNSSLAVALIATGKMRVTMDAGARPSAFDIAQEVLQSTVEAGVDMRDVLRLLLSASAGKSNIVPLGGGAAIVTFRDLADTTDRITATMAGSERAAVIIDPD